MGLKSKSMTRRSAEEKAETHARILRRAAEAFRAHGTGVGIGDIMKDLGLTHGGFYKHFRSKDELLIEAVSLGLSDIAERLRRAADSAEPGHELEAIISAYLSPEHLRNPQTWCALATLAPELARQPAATRKRLDGAMLAYMERLAKYMPGATPQERSGTFLILFSGMSGAIAMARAIGDKDMRDQMLALSRSYYLSTFAFGGETTGAKG
jgi:TetR/AcrR family transcriptional repressor of nem operon